MKQTQIFIAMLLLTLCVLGCGTTDNPVDVNEKETQIGTLQVEVEKIDGVSIHLRLLKDGQLMKYTVSDGINEFDEIAAGEYTLKISAEGYQTTEQNVTIVGGESLSLDKVTLTKLTDSIVLGEGLQIGNSAPDFELPDGNGDMYTLSDYIGKDKKVVIVFYRTGGWTLCTTQLGELQDNYEKIQEAGAELFAISSENVDLTKETVQNEGLTYPVLADSEKDAINAYNVLDQWNTTIARPASYIISQEGTVAWISLDSPSERVPTSTILTELGKL